MPQIRDIGTGQPFSDIGAAEVATGYVAMVESGGVLVPMTPAMLGAGSPSVTLITSASISMRTMAEVLVVTIPAGLPPVVAWGWSMRVGDGLGVGLARYDVTINHAIYLNARGAGGMVDPMSLGAESAQLAAAAGTHARILVAPSPTPDLTLYLTAAAAPTRGVHQITTVLYHR